MSKLFDYLRSTYALSDALVQHLAGVVKTKTFPKKSFLLSAGVVSQHLYFIDTGLVRCFYLKDGQEVSSWFMRDGDFIISVHSFFLRTVSEESIQALDDTTVQYISYDDLQFTYESFPEFNYVGRVLTEKYYALSEQRAYFLRMMRAPERYRFMMQHYPELIQRVPSQYIASYLGITKETLSRIKTSVK